MVIPKFRLTKDGASEFYSGHISHGSEDALVFISLEKLSLLMESPELHSDATYKAIPNKLFQEMLGLHAMLNDVVSRNGIICLYKLLC